jgi:hypothetical protein
LHYRDKTVADPCPPAKEKGCLSASTLIFTKTRAAVDTLASGMDENNQRKSTNWAQQSCSDRVEMKETEWRKRKARWKNQKLMAAVEAMEDLVPLVAPPPPDPADIVLVDAIAGAAFAYRPRGR